MDLAAFIILLFVAQSTKPPFVSSSPNILWIMADDLGWGELEVFPGGSNHGRIATPKLNQFAAEGMQFLNAYAGYTVCAPSRTTFFTGYHSGMFPKYNLTGTKLNPGDAVTITELLKDVGYETALFGKSAPLNDPIGSGFDTFVGQVDQAKCHNMYPKVIDEASERGNFNLSLNWKERSRDLCMANPDEYSYTTDVFQNEALAWLDGYHRRSNLLKEKNQESNPFFLYVSYTVPHAGGWSDSNKEQGNPVPTDGQYSDKDWPNVEKDHASVITYLDNYVGQFLSKLMDLKIDENTITIFASDNGAHLEGGHNYLFFNSTGGLKGHKRSMFEGGHRSPTLIRWPGNVPAGSVSDVEWAFWDVFPTLADLAKIPSSKMPKNISGRSILPSLLGHNDPNQRYQYFTGAHNWANDYYTDEDLFTKSMDHHGGSKMTSYAIRHGRWKGVVKQCTDSPTYEDKMQLFDLIEDPFESTNVAEIYPEEVEGLKNIIASEEGISCKCFQC